MTEAIRPSVLRPFAVAWDEAAVERLLGRVRDYPFAEALPAGDGGAGWRHGTDPGFLRALCRYWVEGFDWRAAMADLNRFPQFRVVVDGVDIHFVHLRGEGRGEGRSPRPLLMTHGWPGSHFEFWGVAEALAFPSRHGGDRADAFDLVIPSLPGFGFSGKPEPQPDPRGIALLFDRLMSEVLGHRRFLAHGGDWGALVTSMLGLHHAAHLPAIHLTMMFPQPGEAPSTPEELAWAAEMAGIEQRLGGYRHLQGSKPRSLAWAMAGNPVAQAAWIVERFHDWSDRRETPFEQLFSREQLLTMAMIYAMNDAMTSSVRIYAAAMDAGVRKLPPGLRVEVPTAFARFPDPLHPWPPRGFAERGFNVSRWTAMPRGGHFAAMEAPDLLVRDLRDWARGAWSD